MSLTDVLIALVLFLCVVLVCLGLDDLEQRSRREEAEDDAERARVRATRLGAQVPFPMGRRLP